MRNTAGPAAFMLSIILTLVLALAGWGAFAMRGISVSVLQKNTPDVARRMLNEGRMDLPAFQQAVNEVPFYGELSYDPPAPEYGLSTWLVAYHTRMTAGYLRFVGIVLFAGAGLSLTVTTLIWVQRPPSSHMAKP